MADSEVRQKEWTILETERLIRKIEQCEGMPAKLILMRHFYEAGMRAGEIARWIPVEEKLPEKSGIVICYGIRANGKSTIQMASFIEGEFDMEDQSFQQQPRATHWQPLPAAPEEK